MGNALESLCGPVCYTRVSVILIGLDFAGKTTILSRLTAKPPCPTPYQPTVGVSHNTFTWNRLRITAWDLGGSRHSRPIWQKYYRSAQVVIFVVDSSDYKRFDEAKCEFCKAVAEKKLSKNAIILVYANKQDQPGALLPSQIEVRFGMNGLPKGRWKVQPSNAHTCDGLFEGMSWVESTLKGKHTAITHFYRKSKKPEEQTAEVKCH